MKYGPIIGGIVLALLMASPAHADEADAIKLVIKDHKFTPDRIEIPAGRKVKVLVQNDDGTPEEFDSMDLHRERIVTGGSQIVIFIGPLDKGEYKFMGEYHSDSANGVVVVK